MLKHLERHFLAYSALAVLGLIIWSWIYILSDQPTAISDLFRAENWGYLTQFLGEMAGIGEEQPAYLNGELWQKALWLSFDTLLMSIFATGIATLAMLLFVLASARNVAQGRFWQRPRAYRLFAYYCSRLLFLFSRAVPELMWAMILVFIFKPGIIAGALALAIHNFGVLGKLCAEVIENMDEKPIQHLAQNGASQSQLLIYGIYPLIAPAILNYVLYRMENIIRATLIVGFVGASALGLEFKLAMSYFHYSEITLYLCCYLLLVYLTDFVSAWVRKRVREN